MEGKACTKCDEWKNLNNFYKGKRFKDGYENQCKKCRLKAMAISNEKRKEDRLKYNKEYYKRTREKQLLYKQKNAEHYRKYKQKYYLANKEYYRKKEKEYRQTEQGKEARFNAELKRRSKKNNVRFTPIQRKYILNRDKWKCQNCDCKVHDSSKNWNTPNKAHIDHILPISKGGDSEPSNLQTLCRTCNLSKYDSVELQLKLF